MYLNSINAPIDIWGVGTNLVTAKGDPNLSGVYKMISIEKNGKFIPKMKISNNIEKSTLPDQKEVARIYLNGQMIFDFIFLKEEKDKIKDHLSLRKEFTIFHPIQENVFKIIKQYDDFEFLIHTVLENGKLCKGYESSLNNIRNKTKLDLGKLEHTYRRIINPHIYKVSISKNLRKLRNKLIKDNKSN